MKIQITKEQKNLLETGSKIQLNNSDDEFLYFLPFWFKFKEGELTGELFMLETLPEEFKDHIKSIRNETTNNK